MMYVSIVVSKDTSLESVGEGKPVILVVVLVTYRKTVHIVDRVKLCQEANFAMFVGALVIWRSTVLLVEIFQCQDKKVVTSAGNLAI